MYIGPVKRMTAVTEQKCNMKKNNPVVLSALVAIMIMLSGCEQAPGVIIHEPGVYKGAADTLHTDAHALNERLKLQMDR